MNFEQTIEFLVERENKNGLDDIRITGVPVWNILKYDIRRRYFLEKGICDSVQSAKGKVVLKESLRGMWMSFVRLHKLLFFPTKFDNLIMGFSRLDNIDGEYLDRFVDPVVEITDLKDNYICFEYGRVGIHQQPRKNIEHTYYTDYIYLLSFLCGYVCALPFLICNRSQIDNFNKLIFHALDLKVGKSYLARKIVEFKCNAFIFSLIISRIQAKRVFGVSRILFRHTAFAAKRKGLPVYEFQHGITLGAVELYSGNYIPEIDPDYFLLFGESCPRNVFGIPENNTINIGWAFKQYLENKSCDDYQHNCCLIISEPQISNQIIDTVLLLAKNYPQMQFHIRRHPQEIFTDEQKKRFANVDNIKDTTNKKNSVLVAMSYDYIIGENSTVLFEGLSLNKKVARLNICGLHPSKREENDAFYYIDDVDDFEKYIKGPVKLLENQAYSEFNVELFNSFLK
jgi:hypothetical protein